MFKTNEEGVPTSLKSIHKSKIFAIPSKSSEDSTQFEYTFPLINFNFENQDEMLEKTRITKHEYLCIELIAIFVDSHWNSQNFENMQNKCPKDILTSNSDKNKVVLFQGGVSYDTLFYGFNEKLKFDQKIKNGNQFFANLIIKEAMQRGNAQMTLVLDSDTKNNNSYFDEELPETRSSEKEPDNQYELNSFPATPNSTSELITKMKALAAVDNKLKCCINSISINYRNIHNDLVNHNFETPN